MKNKLLSFSLALLLLFGNMPVNRLNSEETVDVIEETAETVMEETAEENVETVTEETVEVTTEETDTEPETVPDPDITESVQIDDFSYVAEEDLFALNLQGALSDDVQMAVQIMEEETDLSDDEIQEITDDLFDDDGEEEGSDDQGCVLNSSDNPCRSADGSSIETLTAKWITADTTNNDDPSLLYIRPGSDSLQSIRLQINYALSGEHNYEPGDITITIPAHIFQNRNGSDAGKLVIPYPEEPSTKSDFNWKLVGDNYVLTNTKKMSAATKGYIQFAIEGLVPHNLVDMAVSEPFDAYMQVVTHNGNTIALRSNELTAQFDTEARIINTKKQQRGVSWVDARNVTIPEKWKEEHPEYFDEDGNLAEEEFISVNWYVTGATSANTYYSLTIIDELADEYDGFLAGSDADDYLKRTRENVYNGYNTGTTSSYSYTSYYPASQFEPDMNYEFHNNAKMIVTETDPEAVVSNPNVQDPDPKLVTERESSAVAKWRYTDPVWSDPTGHYMVTKNGNDDKPNNQIHRRGYRYGYSDLHIWKNRSPIHGWYGIYPYALNDMQDGETGEYTTRFSYTVDTVGYILPWTYKEIVPGTMKEDGSGWEIPPTRIKENYMNRPLTITTEDTGVWIEGYRNSERLTVLEDYIFESIEFPGTPWIYDGEPHNINDDGSWEAKHALDGTFLYYRDYDYSHYPDIDLEIYRNGEWEKYATASWKTGSIVITLANGSTQTGTVVNVPADTENFRTVVTSSNAAIDYDIRPVVRLKNTEELKEYIEELFAGNITPEAYVYNGIKMTVERADVEEESADRLVVELTDKGYDVARGYKTDTAVYPSKSASQKSVDYDNRRVVIHYTASVEERSFIPDKVTYLQAIEDGRLIAETHGTWYDLLPKGVVPDLSTITVRANDRVTESYTIENYKGSGRTLLVVEVDLTPQPQTYYDGVDSYYIEDVPYISFDAYYDFDYLKDYGNSLHNVIGFESSNDQIGTIENYRGEEDDPYGNNNISTPRAFANDNEKKWMKDLDPKRDDPSFVYAGTPITVDILSAARTSLSKDVMVNNDGNWGSGVYDNDPTSNAKIVYEGGRYAYRLRMMSNAETISKDLVIYDSLEIFYANEGNDPIDVDAPHWKGTLRSVDVSQLIQKGCAPVVYYSLQSLELADESNPESANTENMDLTDSSIWIKAEDYEGDIAAVKMIAIDATKKADGSDFKLQPLESIVAIVNMQAPSGEAARAYLKQKGVWGDSANAYNNAYMLCTSIDQETGEEDNGSFVRKDYTKVGLKEYNYKVDKIWDDDNDRDGQRPEQITVHLLANGEDTGLEIILPIVDEETQEKSWEASFEHIPYTDADGNKIRYTVKEDEVEHYIGEAKLNGENDTTFTNKHEPEKTSISGEKTWEGDNEDVRPESIIVKLYADGLYKKQLVLRPDNRGEWHYSFDGLNKYRDGGVEIVYTITEEKTSDKSDSYVTEVDGYDIRNIYHPYGDLSVLKNVSDVTEQSKDTLFPFTFSFTLNDADKTPIFDEYDYEILDENDEVVSTGKVATNSVISIKGGQKIHVKELPQGICYKVEETQQDGFTLSSSSNNEGLVKPNKVIEASFNNRYEATGRIDLGAVKKLYNRELLRAQFRFELYEEGSETPLRTATNNMPGVDGVVYREDGTVDYSMADIQFGAMLYDQSDAGKTYTYTVKETVVDKRGYTYSQDVYTVKVTIEDNGDGTLTITPQYYLNDAEADGLSFENIYEADGSLQLRAWKDLKERQLKDGEFLFVLYDEEGNVIDSVTNDGSGTVTFKQLDYDEKDIGKTYHYAVREVKTGDATVIYDETVYGYSVEVVDNGNGTLSFNQGHATPVYEEHDCDVCEASGKVGEDYCTKCGGIGKTLTISSWSEEGQMPIFVNTLEDGSLSISKFITNPDDADPEQEFTFKVKLIGANIPDGEIEFEISAIEEGSDAAEPRTVTAEISGGEFEFVLLGGEKATIKGLPAGSSYQVYEDTPDGWVLAEQSNVSGTIEPLETADAVFKNRYQPGTTSVQFVGTKLLDYRAAKANSFQFMLTDASNDEIETVYVQDGGFIQFSPITYERVTDKVNGDTYVYHIYELDPEDETIDDDMHVETITVVVRDDGEGNLSSEVTYDEDGIAFTNMTRPGNLRITKVAETTEANKDDEFTFKVTLHNADGMPLGSGEQIYWYTEELTADDLGAGNSGSGGNGGNPMAADTLDAVSIIRTGIGYVTPAKEAFHATSDMLQGSAYAVLDSEGTLTFFRSYESYTNLNNGIFTDILGDTYTGKVFSGLENYTSTERNGGGNGPTTSAYPGWSSNAGNGLATSVKRIRMAEGQAIRPQTTNSWFAGCTNLESADLSRMDTSRVKAAWSMFLNCSKLETLDLSGMDFSSCFWMATMFKGCTNLRTLDLSNCNTVGLHCAYDMFMNCSNLEVLNIATLDTREVIDSRGFNSTSCGLNQMFSGCSKLNTVVFGPNFKYYGKNSNRPALLPTPPDGQKWVRTDHSYGPYTPTEHRSNYTSAMAGTWVWESIAEIGFVEFDANGGYTSAAQVKGGPTTVVTMPDETTTTRPHFILLGWNTKADGSGIQYEPGAQVSGIIIIDETVTLFAQWQDTNIRDYKVKHYQQNLTLDGYNLTETENLEAEKGSQVTPDVKEYLGFKKPEKQTETVLDDNSLVIEYYYDRVRYTIAFDGNGSTSGQMSSLPMIGGISERLPANTYQKVGHIFMGWNTEADGSGVALINGQMVNNLTNEDGSTVTLYAQWLDNTQSELNPTDGVIYVTCKPGQTIVIPDLPAGTTYTIEEVDQPNGWSVSDTVGEEGQIISNQNVYSKFTNVYEADTYMYLKAHKRLSGEDLQEGQFTFELLDADKNVIDTVTNDAVDMAEYGEDDNGNTVENVWKDTATVTFNTIHYDQDDIGEHIYYIREKVETVNGIIYDTSEHKVTVTVSDAGHGVLATQIAYEGGEPLFVNNMDVASLKISKTTVDSPDPDETFNFTVNVKDRDGNELGADGTAYTVKIYGEGRGLTNGEIEVKKYSYTENIDDTGKLLSNYGGDWGNSNLRGTDRESASSQAHVVKIEEAESLHVDIYYNSENANYAWASVWDGEKPDNTAYSNWTSSKIPRRLGGVGSGTYTVNGNTLTGMNCQSYDIEGNAVTFSFYSDSYGGHDGAGYGYYAIVTGTYEGEYYTGYDEIPFASGDTITLKGGEYAVIEGLPHGSTYEVVEEEKENWKLTESDGTSGELVAAGQSEASFTNTYEETEYDAKGSIELNARKSVLGGEIDDSFKFVLSTETEVLQKVSCDEEGNIEFALNYVLADLEGEEEMTFTYFIYEVEGDNREMIYDDTRYIVTVTVSDNGDRTLNCVAEIILDDAQGSPVEEMTFVNRVPEGEVQFEAMKYVENEGEPDEIREGETFTFVLTDNKNLFMTATASEDGKIVFDPIRYTKSDLAGTNQKTFTYQIKEAKGTDPRITYDETVYTVKVKVSDDGTEELKTEVTYVDLEDEIMSFTNVRINYADLIIRKLVDRYELDTEKSFIYKVEVFVDEEKTEEKFVQLLYSKQEGGLKEAVIKDIPIGATVKVTEIYTGASYELQSENEVTLMIEAPPIDGGEANVATFINTYGDYHEKGTSVKNTYSRDEEGDWEISQEGGNR